MCLCKTIQSQYLYRKHGNVTFLSVRCLFQVKNKQLGSKKLSRPIQWLSTFYCQWVSSAFSHFHSRKGRIQSFAPSSETSRRPDSSARPHACLCSQWSRLCWCSEQCWCGDTGAWKTPTPSTLKTPCTRKPQRMSSTSAGMAPRATFTLRLSSSSHHLTFMLRASFAPVLTRHPIFFSVFFCFDRGRCWAWTTSTSHDPKDEETTLIFMEVAFSNCCYLTWLASMCWVHSVVPISDLGTGTETRNQRFWNVGMTK